MIIELQVKARRHVRASRCGARSAGRDYAFWSVRPQCQERGKDSGAGAGAGAGAVARRPPLDAKAHVGRRATVAGCHGVMSDVGGWLRLCSAIQTITGIRAEVARQPTNMHRDYQRDYRAVSQVGRCGRSQGVQQSARDRRQTGRRCYALGACGSTPS